jgi:malate dehydrogenase (oxaloacetate-decarboxylating)(NADP+)
MGNDDNLMRLVVSKARRNVKRVAFAEAEDHRILKAAQIASEDGICTPILIGNKSVIEQLMKDHKIDLPEAKIYDPRSESTKHLREEFAEIYFGKRQRRGINLYEAHDRVKKRNYFSTLLVETGRADAVISGITRNYSEVIRPALQVIGTAPGVEKVASCYLMLTQKGPLFFTDTTMIVDPTSEELAEIGRLTAKFVKDTFGIKPSVAFLSHSVFGSNSGSESNRVRSAVKILAEKMPEATVDGEIQANLVFNKESLKDNYPFSPLIDNPANILVFPNLSAANIAYKLLQELSTAEAIGPIMLGMKKPVHILQLSSSVREIVNMVAIATVDAQLGHK